MDGDELPDPADVAAYLNFIADRTADLRARRLLHYGARYILAGLELAHDHQSRRTS